MADIAFRMGRKLGKHPVAGRLFCLVERLLPLRRISRTPELVAFHHPRPVSNPHVLIVPTRPFSELLSEEVNDGRRAELVWEIVHMGQNLSARLSEGNTWLLVINGGERQEIGQMHAHLLPDSDMPGESTVLVDPADNILLWQQLFSELRQLSTESGIGYSLEIRWNADNSPVARVTHSTRTY